MKHLQQMGHIQLLALVVQVMRMWNSREDDMTHAEIRAVVAANGWQGKTAGDVATLLNAPSTRIVTFQAGIGTILSRLGPEDGTTVLNTIESLKTVDPAIKWGWYLIERGDLDFGDPVTRLMIDKLVSESIITPEIGAKLKGLAEQTVTANVTVQAVIDAMEGM